MECGLQVEFREKIKVALPRSAIVVVVTIVSSTIVLPSPGEVLAEGLYADDAFYYFEIASNFVRGNGITFDTINVTNGFQVLWLLMLLPVATVISDPDVFISVVWWMQVLLGGIAAGLTFVLAYALDPRSKVWIPGAIVASALPFLPLWNGGMVNGLETPAFVTALLASLLLLQNFRVSPSTQSAWLLALGLTLTVLGRLDGLLFIALAAIAIWAWNAGTVQQRLTALLPPIAVAATYLAANSLFFDSLSPVSGATKTIWGERQLQALIETGAPEWRLRLSNIAWPREYLDPLTSRLPGMVGEGLVIDVVVVLAVVTAYALMTRYYWRNGIPVLVVFQIFLLGKFLVYGYLQFGYANYTWYWALDLIGVVLFVVVLVQGLMARQHPVGTARAVSVMATFIVFGLVGNFLVERGRAWLAPDSVTNEIAEYAGMKYAAETLNDAPDSRDLLLSASDAGILGFYLSGPLVNTDGLVNGRERLEFTKLHGQDQLPYLQAHPEFDGFVNWVPTGAFPDTVERMDQAGFTEVPSFADCVAYAHGSAQNHRGQIRLFLRPAQAAAWRCPISR